MAVYPETTYIKQTKLKVQTRQQHQTSYRYNPVGDLATPSGGNANVTRSGALVVPIFPRLKTRWKDLPS